jgi:1,4-alpha-glucan branching enzyme
VIGIREEEREEERKTDWTMRAPQRRRSSRGITKKIKRREEMEMKPPNGVWTVKSASVSFGKRSKCFIEFRTILVQKTRE